MSRIGKLLEKRINEETEHSEYKMVFIRDSDRGSIFEQGAAKLGLREEDVIGWFATPANNAYGYTIFKPSKEIRNEFGYEAFQVYNVGKDVATVVKFNLDLGRVSFFDNSQYEASGKVTWLSGIKFDRLFIDKGKEDGFKFAGGYKLSNNESFEKEDLVKIIGKFSKEVRDTVSKAAVDIDIKEIEKTDKGLADELGKVFADINSALFCLVKISTKIRR